MDDSSESLVDIRARYRPRARGWFQPEITYDAVGSAEFSSNPGTIRGPLSIYFREDGIAENFQMVVEELVADAYPDLSAPEDIFMFVHALPIAEPPGAFGLGGSSNACTDLVAHGDGFSLSAANPIVSASDHGVDFRPNRTIVRFAVDVEPVYWAAPLLNFVSDFAIARTELQAHPLRLRETDTLELAGDRADYVRESLYRQANALIPFESENGLGFVEPLFDYASRRARVDAGETLVTAVMVGRVPAEFHDADHEEWFPSDLLTLLGLAAGREIGVPFVELRGPEGELVARMHMRAGTPTSSRRTPLIDESMDRSTGALLTAFLSSPYRGRLWLRVSLRHLLRALTREMTVEDRLGHLFRAAEGLAGGLKVGRPRPLELTAASRRRVDGALEDCVTALETLANNAPAKDRDRIKAVTTRVKDIRLNRPALGSQLLDLVRHVRLPDASWLRDFKFRVKLSGGERAWASAASQYRNRIFHAGFINFEQYDVENAVSFGNHLSDVLSRVVFRLIGFESSYRPPCGAYGMVTHESPDWPTPERLNAQLLRYIA